MSTEIGNAVGTREPFELSPVFPETTPPLVPISGVDCPLQPVGNGDLVPANGNSDRRPNGTFAPGNRAAAGHTTEVGRRQAELRSRLLAAVSDEDFDSIIRQLIDRARAGERWAVSLFLQYAVGSPDILLMERLERLEITLRGGEPAALPLSLRLSLPTAPPPAAVAQPDGPEG